MTNKAFIPSIPAGIRVQLWRILVQPLPPDEKSAGGIILADETQTAQQYNTKVVQVLEVGAQAYDGQTKSGIPLDRVERVMPGDWVLIGAYAGQSVELKDGAELKFITPDMVLAKVDDPYAFKRYV